ncbi:MAG TPA: hypothetical protein VMV92_04240 [Streptosporangiaceae bacterium]|nr:hypothetical protein [Streptosporangiaceae bacterium]
MAAGPARRGHGFAAVILGRVLGELAAGGVNVVEAKTLDCSAGYEPYKATRAFWERRGLHPGRPGRSAPWVATGQPRSHLHSGPAAHPVTSAG